MATAIGTGTTVTHTNLVGNLLSVAIDGVEITAIDNTHMGTTDYRSLIAGSLANPGQVTLELQFDPATIRCDEYIDRSNLTTAASQMQPDPRDC